MPAATRRRSLPNRGVDFATLVELVATSGVSQTSARNRLMVPPRNPTTVSGRLADAYAPQIWAPGEQARQG